MNTLNKWLIGVWIAALLILFIFFFIWLKDDLYKTPKQLTSPANEQVDRTEEQQISEPQPQSATIGMIGDVLLHLHLAQYEHFVSSFEAMQPEMEALDFLIANQESPPAGPAYKLSGYPRFSSPAHIIRDLKTVGVDMVNLANNHILDKDEGGMRQVFDNLATYDMPYVGAYENEADENTLRIVEKNGISFGILAYTYGTNGLFLPKNSPYKIAYIDDGKIEAEVNAAKQVVDVVIVSMHWGPEYVTTPSDEERRLAALLNNAGAHIVFGAHPHVIQPYEVMQNSEGHQTHIFYSIGNFFATNTLSMDTMIGGLASVKVTKLDDEITITDPTFTVSVNVQDSDGIYRLHRLKDAEAKAPRNMDWARSILGQDILVQ